MENSAEFQQISDLIYCASNALKNLAGKKDLLLDEWDYRIELFPTSGVTQLEAEFGEMGAALEGVEMICLKYGDKTSIFPINQVAPIAHDLLQLIQQSLESRGELAPRYDSEAAQMWKVYDEKQWRLLEMTRNQSIESGQHPEAGQG
jgi:hypothetical protein